MTRVVILAANLLAGWTVGATILCCAAVVPLAVLICLVHYHHAWGQVWLALFCGAMLGLIAYAVIPDQIVGFMTAIGGITGSALVSLVQAERGRTAQARP